MSDPEAEARELVEQHVQFGGEFMNQQLWTANKEKLITAIAQVMRERDEAHAQRFAAQWDRAEARHYQGDAERVRNENYTLRAQVEALMKKLEHVQRKLEGSTFRPPWDGAMLAQDIRQALDLLNARLKDSKNGQ